MTLFQDAEEERIRKEKEKKEKEEYEAWKKAIEIEQQGNRELELKAREKKMGEIVEFVNSKKVVLLEDIGAEFELKTVVFSYQHLINKDVIEIIEKLSKEGKLTGVIDDRGKFICVTRDEFEKVAAFMKRKGRLSIEEITAQCNKLINLKPKE